jgi:GTPase SAR1 family protein
MSIYNTAGQERFHAITPMYYRHCDACVLVVSNERQSWEGAFAWIAVHSYVTSIVSKGLR